MVENLSDETPFYPLQWLCEKISNFGLMVSAKHETKLFVNQQKASEALDNLHRFRADPAMIQVAYNILVKPRTYRGIHSIKIRKETGEYLYRVIPGQYVMDVHFGQGLYDDLEQKKVTTLEIVLAIEEKLAATEFAEAPLFNTSILASHIANDLGLVSWRLPEGSRALRDMFVSYGQHALCSIDVEPSDVSSIFITPEDIAQLKTPKQLCEVDEGYDDLNRFEL